MIIRQARKSDLIRILEFMGKQQVKRTDWHISAKKFVLSYITNKHNFFFICVENSKVIGSIAGESWDDKGFAYVGEITAKGKNPKQVIDKLFERFLVFCKKKNIKTINTYVKKNKSDQIKTYKKMGMKKLGDYLYFERRL